MEKRVLELIDRFSEVEKLLGDPSVLSDQASYKNLTQEHAYLCQVKEAWEHLVKMQKQLQEDRQVLSGETDQELIEMLRDEIAFLEQEIPSAEAKVKTLLVPPDPNDHRNVIVEVRAGTGGDEAALFVGDMIRMYQLYSGRRGWKWELLSSTESQAGGYKEYIMVISGDNVYRLMRHEGGTHRVQRVPATETQGRLHTSAATVAILMEPDQEEQITLDEKDLKIDTFRASGPGGQHVNTTDSGVRITHIPTGVAAYCTQERSQLKNREKAMRLLQAKIAEEKRRKAFEERSEQRLSQVGTGDRSERIRTYNYPQNRVTDHRIDLTLYHLNMIVDGDLDEITEALVSYFYDIKLQTGL